MILEFRDTNRAVLDQLETSLLKRIAEENEVSVDAESTARIEPALMAGHLGETLAAAARELGEQAMTLPSGAGHDAMVLSRIVPSAMLFVPSIGGRSHDVTENTSDADIVFGCEVLGRAVDKLREKFADAPSPVAAGNGR